MTTLPFVLQKDFLSLELVEGHVRLAFDLGSGALIKTSSRKYNTGIWYKVTLQRNKRKGWSVTSRTHGFKRHSFDWILALSRLPFHHGSRPAIGEGGVRGGVSRNGL